MTLLAELDGRVAHGEKRKLAYVIIDMPTLRAAAAELSRLGKIEAEAWRLMADCEQGIRDKVLMPEDTPRAVGMLWAARRIWEAGNGRG